MKHINKIILLSTLLSLGLVGCNSQEKSSQSQTSSTECGDCSVPAFHTQPLGIKVAAPAGSPALALFAHLSESDVEINAAENVQAYMTDTANKDIVILPTNYGVNAIVNKGVSFKLAATVTFGNFFLLSTGNDDNATLDSGDKVLAFQQNGVAGKLFNYLYGDKELSVKYEADAKTVKDAVLTGGDSFDYDYVLLAQPVVNVILQKKTSYSLYASLQEDYKTKSGGKEITQASIFVKNSADVTKAKAALATIKSDVEQLLKNHQEVIDQTKNLEEEVISAKFTATAQAVKGLLDNGNQLGVGYKDAFDNKTNIDAFLASLGMGATSEDIYFRS